MTDAEIQEIPRLETKNLFHALSEKLSHLIEHVTEFIRKSGIHGVNNLEGSFRKKIFWLLIVSVATVATVHFLQELFEASPRYQVTIEYDDETWNVKDIPFPTVTYCPELNRTLLEQLVECRLHGHCDGLTSSQISININALRAGCKFCKFMETELAEIERKFKWELILEDYSNRTYIHYLKNFLDSSLIKHQSFCMSGRKNLQLRESLAYNGGFCYTIGQEEGIFNENIVAEDFKNYEILASECDQSSFGDFSRAEMKISLRYPRPSNLEWLLTNLTNVNDHFNYLSDLGTIGVTSSRNFPVSTFYLQHSLSYYLIATPYAIKTDEKLRSISPLMRKCFFEDEQKLLYFNKYSENNCVFECQSRMTEEMCLCVPFDYPRHPDSRICTNEKYSCIDRILSTLSDPTSSMYRSCDCLAACNELSFSTEMIADKISPKHLQNFTNSGDYALEAEVTILYRENEFVGYKRVLRSDLATFLSKVGAILWLLLGASVLSIVEVIYFFTLRFFNNLWIH